MGIEELDTYSTWATNDGDHTLSLSPIEQFLSLDWPKKEEEEERERWVCLGVLLMLPMIGFNNGLSLLQLED